MKKIGLEEFDRVVTENPIVLVDFYANWCGPCKMLTPVLEQFMEDVKSEIEIVKVDVDETPELCGRYNITSIPTLLFFKEGKLIFKEIGFRSKDYLLEILNKIKESE